MKDRTGAESRLGPLPSTATVLAVCAHPDDESFGLGAALDTFVDRGSSTSVLVFTHGEASQLGSALDLRSVRWAELNAAAKELRVSHLKLLDHPDGALADRPLEQLTAQVGEFATLVGADLLLTFDEGGITGHPDHQRATEAAVAHAERAGIAVLAWAIPRTVALTLNREYGASFVGRDEHQLDLVAQVGRLAQRRASACHASQANGNPVLWRRLELLGDREYFRWLIPPR